MTNLMIWQHCVSGERYVVEVDYAGIVIGACGPLHYDELTVVLTGDFTSDNDLAHDINVTQFDYRVIEVS